MDTSWKRAIDQTLHNTRATLRRLQERHAVYDVAKRRVDEAFGPISPSSPPHGGGGAHHSPGSHLREPSPLLSRQDPSYGAAVPPPLPTSSATGLYYGTNGSAIATAAAAAPLFPNASGPTWDSGHLSGPSAAPSPSSVRELADAFRVLQAQLRGVTVELELERTVRADGLRELAGRHAREVRQLTEIAKQLRDDNAFLKDSVRALEIHGAFGRGGSPALGRSNLDGARSTFLSHLTTCPDGGGSPADDRVRQRLAELEEKILRQQRLLDERGGRVDALLRELVDAKVGAEVERMRGIAREAAREATEDLVKARLAAVQSLFHDELRAVLQRAGVTEEISQTTERLFRQHEREWGGRFEALQAVVAALEKAAAAQAEANDGVGGRLAELERRAESGQAAAEAGLAAARQEAQEQHLRLTQSSAARLESTRVELLAAVARAAQEQTARDGILGGQAREAEMRRVVEGSVAPVESRLESVAAAARTLREGGDELRAAVQRLAAALDEETTRRRDEAAEVQRALTARSAAAEKQRADLAACQSQLRAVAVATEDAAGAGAESLALGRRLQERYADEVVKLDAQVRRLTQGQDAAKERLQSATADREALAERVGEVEASVRGVEAALPRAVQPLAAKVDSLQKTMNATCLPGLDAVQDGLAAATALAQQVGDARASHDRQAAQQLSALRAELEAGSRERAAQLRREGEERQARQEAALGAAAATVAALQHSVTASCADATATAQELGGRLAALEARSAAPAPVAATHESSAVAATAARAPAERPAGDSVAAVEAATAMIAAQREWVTARLDGADERQQERLRHEAVALRDEREAGERKAAAHTAQALADVTAHLAHVEAAARDGTEALDGRLAAAEEHAAGLVRASHDRLRELLAPTRLAGALAADEPALSQLAAALQDRLGSSPESRGAAAESRAALRAVDQRLAQLALAVETASGSGGGGPVATESAGPSAADAPPSAALLRRLADSEEATEQALQQLRRQAREAQQAAHDCQARLEDLAPGLQLRLTGVEAGCRELLESHGGVPAMVQQRVAAAAEAQRAAHAAALEPVEARARLAEKACRAMGSSSHEQLSELAAAHARELAELRATVAGLRSSAEAQQAVLLAEYLHPLQERVASLGSRADEARATPVVEAGPTAAELERLGARLTALEGVTQGIEGDGEAGLVATADALQTLRDGLQECIDKARDYLRRDKWAVGVHPPPSQERDDDAAVVVVPALNSLDDLFLFLLEQVSSIHTALGTLQQNAVATLELIQQQELDALAIGPLQAAVVQIADNLKPIARATGCDPALFTIDLGGLIRAPMGEDTSGM